ncbi:protein of unknown function [Kyrpidia spormannii]|uniref:Uncharacterized protein n=2 Tax=Kyrpidia spormannii TaxID=2055160 RepID=A0ACA8ZEU9_9BACL|nr:protein of unknown function [Kyrpidia spormannii]CAB3395260.1 protein of unknown function [Kyrpidia spormannii]
MRVRGECRHGGHHEHFKGWTGPDRLFPGLAPGSRPLAAERSTQGVQPLPLMAGRNPRLQAG